MQSRFAYHKKCPLDKYTGFTKKKCTLAQPASAVCYGNKFNLFHCGLVVNYGCLHHTANPVAGGERSCLNRTESHKYIFAISDDLVICVN